MTANPLWDFSLDVYARNGVADACIALQDEAGLDVNLLLFCIWCAAQGPGRLTPDDLRDALALTDDWQAEIVKPLRSVRRRAKTMPGPPLFLGAFHRDIAATELSAERVEQWVLYDSVNERSEDDRNNTAALSAACANLVSYLRAAGVEPTPQRSHLAVLLSASFPDLDNKMISDALGRAFSSGGA